MNTQIFNAEPTIKTGDSFVILGSPRSNPWSALFEDKLELKFVFDANGERVAFFGILLYAVYSTMRKNRKHVPDVMSLVVRCRATPFIVSNV